MTSPARRHDHDEEEQEHQESRTESHDESQIETLRGSRRDERMRAAASLTAWCNANKTLLSDDIIERTQGRAHDH